MSISLSKVYNASVYLNGHSLIGKAKEVDLPKIKTIFADIDGLGLYGKAEVSIGVDKMEARLLMNTIEPEFEKIASNPRKNATIIVRSSLTGFDQNGVSFEKAIKAEMRGTFKERDSGKFKAGEGVESEATMSVIYYKLEVDGQVLVEMDVLNNIFKSNNEDILQEFRANLGG